MVLGFSFFFVTLNHLAEYVFIGLGIIWIAEKLSTHGFHLQKTFWDLPIFLFLMWILVTIFFAVDPSYSFSEWRKALPRFLIFWFVVNTIKTEDQVRSILLASSMGLGALSLFEIAYFFGNGGKVLELFMMGGASRAGALTGSSQWLSTFLVLGFPIVLLGLWCEPVGKMRLGYIIICSVMLGALLLVFTRAGWLAIIIELVMFGILMVKRIWRVGGLLSIGCLVLILLLSNVSKFSFVTESQMVNSMTLQIRFNTWNFAIEKIVEDPSMGFTGIGYGKHSFYKAFNDLGPGLHTHIHNMFLARAVQIGIPGLLLFAWIFGMVLLKSFRGFKYFPHQYVGKLSLAIFLATIGLIVRNLFDDMFIGSIVYVFCLFVGLFCATINLNGTRCAGGNLSTDPNRVSAGEGYMRFLTEISRKSISFAIHTNDILKIVNHHVTFSSYRPLEYRESFHIPS